MWYCYVGKLRYHVFFSGLLDLFSFFLSRLSVFPRVMSSCCTPALDLHVGVCPLSLNSIPSGRGTVYSMAHMYSSGWRSSLRVFMSPDECDPSATAPASSTSAPAMKTTARGAGTLCWRPRHQSPKRWSLVSDLCSLPLQFCPAYLVYQCLASQRWPQNASIKLFLHIYPPKNQFIRRCHPYARKSAPQAALSR